MKGLVVYFTALVIASDVQALDLGFNHLLTTNRQGYRGYDWCRTSGWGRFNNKNHTGKDYSEGTPTSISFGKVSLKNPDGHSSPYDNCASGDCSMGNVVILQYLMNTGKYIYALYAHLNSFNYTIDQGRYVVPEQQIGILGSTDTTIRHLHFEIKDYNMLGNSSNQGWGYVTYNNSNCNIDPDDYGYHNPVNFMHDSTNQVALPLLSRTTSTPSRNNYDVYGIENKTLYGFLNLRGRFTRSSIVVRDFFSRTQVNQRRGGLSDNLRFLGGKNENRNVNNIKGQNIYTSGDYLFVAYVQDGSNHRFGYPVKFSILPEGSFIIDNDQLNADHDPNNDNENELTYNSINPSYLNNHNVVPGYFLTADLYPGQSNAWVQWKPYKKGKYKIYIYIPENGATAQNVKYKIKSDGNQELISDPINQRENRGKWVLLTANNGSIKEFSLEKNGYIGLSLDNVTNSAVRATEYVAFDAIKFIKVKDEPTQETTNILSMSSFDGAGSIVRPQEYCEEIGGYGCYQDIAIMHKNNSKTSTVVFQWKREYGCQNLIISSSENFDGVLMQKDWKSLDFDRAYEVHLEGYGSYISISPSGIWTTLSITSKEPLNNDIIIQAECANDISEYSSSYSYKREISVYDKKIEFEEGRWSGTGSIINTDDEFEGVGRSLDLVILQKDVNSVASMQWHTTFECQQLKVIGLNSNYKEDNNIDLNRVEIKEWDASNDNFRSVCNSLPCYIQAPDLYRYYVLKIITKPTNRDNTMIGAECIY